MAERFVPRPAWATPQQWAMLITVVTELAKAPFNGMEGFRMDHGPFAPGADLFAWRRGPRGIEILPVKTPVLHLKQRKPAPKFHQKRR